MSKRTAPYRHQDGSTCWTKGCSRGNFFVGQQRVDFTAVDFYGAEISTVQDADPEDLAFLHSLLTEPPAGESVVDYEVASDGPHQIHAESGAELNAHYSFRSRLPQAYDPARHAPVRNPGAEVSWTKPRGGFWLSTLGTNGKSSWDNFIHPSLRASVEHTVKFAPEAKVLVIDTRQDYLAALARYPHHSELGVPEEMRDWFPQGAISQMRADGSAKRGLHWEQLAQDYDAVLLTDHGLARCGGGDYMGEQFPDDISLYIWEIESAIVFHPGAIVVEQG